MNHIAEALIPITLFVCIFLAIKAVVDARVRRRMLDSPGAEDMVRAMIAGDEERRRNGSLRWGIVLVALAVGFGVIEATGVREVTPGVFALLLAATGLGNLGYWVMGRRAK